MQAIDMHQGLNDALVAPLAPEAEQTILVCGAREHNLKNITLRIPRDKFVVVTGVSGSGKSTLVFDILFAEGQRRYLDLMNAYARQYVEQLPKPDVDLVDGLPPTVSIEQRDRAGGGKSTVATVTEVYHFIRLLFARLGVIYCPECQVPVQPQSQQEATTQLLNLLREHGELTLLAPVVRARKGFHSEVAEFAEARGFTAVRADGKFYAAGERFRLDRHREHNVEILTGRMRRGAAGKPVVCDTPITGGVDALVTETFKLGKGSMLVLLPDNSICVLSTERACPRCSRAFEPLDPKHFSYNSPAGWCPRCRGFGEVFWLPPDVDRGARADEIEESWFEWMESERELCPECNGQRLNPVARAVRLPLSVPPSLLRKLNKNTRVDSHDGGPALTIGAISALDTITALELFEAAQFTGRGAVIARDLVPEIRSRLRFLVRVGLDYLQLGRAVPTLSGGEMQRIRLAAQLGSNLAGVLYILDEPTIGLHPRDNQRLLRALLELRRRGNSVIVVEHDPATIRQAEFVVELGPGAGVHGGRVVYAGTLRDLLRCADSVTWKWLRLRQRYPTRGARRPVELPRRGANQAHGWLILHNARKNNLRNLTVGFPLGRFIVVTGVSGSGKSTLVRECLVPALKAALEGGEGEAAASGAPEVMFVTGHEQIRAVYEVDQSPIGRTPRSVPATYVGFFDYIRKLFAQLPEARMRGYGPGRFSFNSPAGRCPACQGAGVIKLEMSFMPAAFVQCENCRGARYTPETLEIRYRGKNIAEVLDMSVEEALDFFAQIPAVALPLRTLCETGLGYLKLGQPSPTLSGGEAQRIKLVTHLITGLKDNTELTKPQKRNLFVLEEPTTGLHMADVHRLVEIIQRLVDFGHTVIVIEHNLELIAEADWVIDLGPEGGQHGGRIVAEGTPEQIAKNKKSYTGRFLCKLLTA